MWHELSMASSLLWDLPDMPGVTYWCETGLFPAGHPSTGLGGPCVPLAALLSH